MLRQWKQWDVITWILTGDIGDHYVVVFNLTSMQDAAENCHYPDLVADVLWLELNFIFLRDHVAELIVLAKRLSLVAVDKNGVFGRNV